MLIVTVINSRVTGIDLSQGRKKFSRRITDLAVKADRQGIFKDDCYSLRPLNIECRTRNRRM